MRRRFAAEHCDFVPADIWAEQRQKALDEVRKDAAFEGIGYDIDPAAVALANANAKLAGVGDQLLILLVDLADYAIHNLYALVGIADQVLHDAADLCRLLSFYKSQDVRQNGFTSV